MRFVFVTDELPRPNQAGHLTMNHAIIVWLQSLGHNVTILLTGARLAWPAQRYDIAPVTGPAIAQRGPFIFAASLRAQARAASRQLAARLPPALADRLRGRVRSRRFGEADTVLGAFVTPEQAAWCARYIAAARPDAVLIDTIFRAPVLAAMPAPPRSILITHDVFHRRHQAVTAAGYRPHPAELSRETEAALLNNASALIAIQPEEAELLRAMCPHLPVFTAPPPALPNPRPATQSRLLDRLVFVGSATLPNLDGLRWFLAEMWPELRAARPGLTLDIAGDCGAALSQPPAGVILLGRVATLAPILHRATLAIAPLRVGSGLKIKLLDYARHGLTTIATPASLAGFAADPAAPFIAALTPTDFAHATLRQLDAGAEDSRALNYVARHYGAAASFAGLAAALEL